MASAIRVLRTAAVVLVGVVAVGAAASYWLSSARMDKRYALVESPVVTAQGPTAISEGKRLFISRGCVDCHGADLSGQTFVDEPAIGTYTGANLTGGKGGIGARSSDGDFARAIRHGIAADGRALIFMPATDFQGMSDEDVGRIIAYIRSVPPIDKPSSAQRVGPIGRVLFLAGQFPLLVTAELIDHTAKAPAQVSAAVTVEYGRYLTGTCTGCHGHHLQGGPIPGGPPDWPPAPNLTRAGMESWSEADFITALRTGVRPNGAAIRAPMPWQNTKLMTDVELKAMWLYLRTLPAVAVGRH